VSSSFDLIFSTCTVLRLHHAACYAEVERFTTDAAFKKKKDASTWYKGLAYGVEGIPRFWEVEGDFDLVAMQVFFKEDAIEQRPELWAALAATCWEEHAVEGWKAEFSDCVMNSYEDAVERHCIILDTSKTQFEIGLLTEYIRLFDENIGCTKDFFTDFDKSDLKGKIGPAQIMYLSASTINGQTWFGGGHSLSTFQTHHTGERKACIRVADVLSAQGATMVEAFQAPDLKYCDAGIYGIDSTSTFNDGSKPFYVNRKQVIPKRKNGKPASDAHIGSVVALFSALHDCAFKEKKETIVEKVKKVIKKTVKRSAVVPRVPVAPLKKVAAKRKAPALPKAKVKKTKKQRRVL
jgi:hypothetical protein